MRQLRVKKRKVLLDDEGWVRVENERREVKCGKRPEV